MADTVETAVYRLRVEGQAEIDRLTKSVDGLAVSEEKAASSTRTFSQALQNNVARIDPLVRAQEQYRKALETNLRYRETGVGTEAQLNAQLEASTKRYQQQVSVINQVEKATVSHTNAQKLQGYQMLNLSRQIQDIGVSLFGGQSPITVMVQQLPQIADISQQSGVSLTNMFKQAGSAALAFVTPMTVAIGAVAALAAGAVYAALQIDKLQVSSQRAISGAGARTGTTVEDINRFQSQNTPSAFTGAGLSQKESRALAEGLTQTGDIVISKLHSMSDAVVGFANQTGKSMDEAIKDFIRFGKEPVKALDDLEKAFGPVSQKTRDLVEDYVALGDKTGAYNVILDATAKKAKEAADNMTLLEKVGRGAINALQTGPRPTGLDTQLQGAKTALDKALATTPDMLNPEAIAAYSNEIQKLNKAFEDLFARQQAVIAQKVEDQMNAIADKARLATDALIPQNEQLKQMEIRLNQLKAAQSADVGGPDLSAAITAQENLIAKTRESKEETARYDERVKEIAGSWGNVGQATALALEAAKNNLPVLEAVGGAAKMAAQSTADYKNAMDAGKTSTEAAALAASNLAAAQAQVNSAAKETLWNLQNQAAAAGAVTGAAQMAAQAEATKNQLIHDGVNGYIAQAVAAQQLANAQAAATAGVLRQIEALKDSTAMIRAQQDGTEATTAAAIAYKNAIKSGASETSAAALAAATLENKMAGAASAAFDLGQNLQQIVNAEATLSQVVTTAGADMRAQRQLANAIHAYDQSGFGVYPAGSRADYFSSPNQMTGGSFIADPRAIVSYRGGGTGRRLSIDDEAFTRSLMGPVPETPVKDLTNSIDQLKTSTDNLNATNQDLLSPYYTQDPRTTHIGFRSQGMALGGYVEVPGGYSTNDNMVATIPVASGERIYVDPMGDKRGVGTGGGMTINISSPITINGNANADQFGRTVYQANQQLAKQMRAATQ